VDDVKSDIDAVYRHVEALRRLSDEPGQMPQHQVRRLAERVEPDQAEAFAAAFNWLFVGELKSVFLQDANSLVVKPADLVEILTHLMRRFPSVERITSYARSQTIASRKLADLKTIRDAGLTRLHVGLESGSDEVLKMVNKGCTKKMHIKAGLKAKQAGFEVSEYFMPGLGGRRLSEAHALESAEVLSQIDPDFIRLRTLAIPKSAPLYAAYRDGSFQKCTDVMVAEELLTLIENLRGINSVVKSDHILNLLGDLEGTLPQDQDAMITILRTFLEMDPQRRARFQLGRRLGILSSVDDMDDRGKMALVEANCRQMGVTPDNVDQITDELVTGFV
jgi:hypothetical protein